MVHRLKAAILLLVVGLVLPVAGVPQRFCALSAVFVAGDQACVACPADDPLCDCEGGENPSRPNCMTSAKVIPDGIAQEALLLPSSQSMELPPQRVGMCPPWRNAMRNCVGPLDRGPPVGGGLPLYLRNHALLI